MSAYPRLDFLDDLTWSEMNWAWRLDLDPVRDTELGQFYGRTARYSTTDPYAGEDDLFVFHATFGMGYTVQSGSYYDPFQLRIYDDAGNAIAADDGSGAYGYDYAAFTAAYTGWYYIDASWDQDLRHLCQRERVREPAPHDHPDHRHGRARHLVRHAHE
jgi:serralysin